MTGPAAELSQCHVTVLNVYMLALNGVSGSMESR